jgi:hypothetical protein
VVRHVDDRHGHAETCEQEIDNSAVTWFSLTPNNSRAAVYESGVDLIGPAPPSSRWDGEEQLITERAT